MAKTRIDRTLNELKNMSPRDIRALYADLRDVIRKRQTRLTAANFQKGLEFPKLKELDQQGATPGELMSWVMEAQAFLGNKLTTIRGMRARNRATVEAINKGGIEFVDEGNLDKFTAFMERARQHALGHKLLDSFVIARIYDQAQRLRISTRVLEKKFNVFHLSQEKILKLYDALESMERPEGRKRITSTEVYEQLGVEGREDWLSRH